MRFTAQVRAWARALRILPAVRGASRRFDRRLADAGHGPPSGTVGLFVPGWCATSGVGVLLMQRLAERLGLDAVLYCGFGPEARPHAEKCAELDRLLAAPAVRAAERVVVVAHSYGGLLACSTLLDSAIAPRCHVFTINTPFFGPRPLLGPAGRAAGLLVLGRRSDPELAFMRRDGESLRHLRARLEARAFHLTTIAAPEDEFVSERSATLPGCACVLGAARGHNGPLVRDDQIAEVVEAIARRCAEDDRA